MSFTDQDRAKFGAEKVELLEQLIREAGLPPPGQDVGGYMLTVPDPDDPSDVYTTTFESCSAAELRRALAKVRSAKPAPQPIPTPPPAPLPPVSTQPQPPAPLPPVSRPPSPQPASPPPAQPKPPQPPGPEPRPPVQQPAPPRAPSAPVPPAPMPVPSGSRPASRWVLYALVAGAVAVVGYRVLADRSERFEQEHRSLGQLPDQARPSPSTSSPTEKRPTHPPPHPQRIVGQQSAPVATPVSVDAGPRVVEDEKNDMTPEQLEEEQRQQLLDREWDPLKKMKR